MRELSEVFKLIDFFFLMNSVLLGAGLAMDAFSVSLANGLAEPRMSPPRMSLIAGTYAFFQFAMPMIGWLCVHTMLEHFSSFQSTTPWISLALLAYIGGEMIRDGVRDNKKLKSGEKTKKTRLRLATLLFQGVATSIDALSVGFTIAGHDTAMALSCSLIIAVTTFIICTAGLMLGKRFGLMLAGRAQILGGAILIAIGLEIFVTGVLL